MRRVQPDLKHWQKFITELAIFCVWIAKKVNKNLAQMRKAVHDYAFGSHHLFTILFGLSFYSQTWINTKRRQKLTITILRKLKKINHDKFKKNEI